jgi:plastocyanin domain-containing protein
MPRALPHLLLVVLLWIGLGWAADGRAQSTAAPLPSFTLTVKDGVFSPRRLEVPAGQRVKLVLKNEGPGPLEFENAEMNVEKILAAGAESFVVLPRMKSGEYEFVDEYNMVTGVMTVIAK